MGKKREECNELKRNVIGNEAIKQKSAETQQKILSVC